MRIMPVAAALAAGFVAGASAPASASPAAFPPPTFPNVVGVQLKNGSDWSVETIDKVHELGFGVVRKGMYWNSVEKEKGVYDFSKYDDVVDRACGYGMTVVLTFFNAHDLYESAADKAAAGKERSRGIVTEKGRQGFAAFAAAAAEHYKGKKIIFEIWNEPNVSTFWGRHGTHNTKPFADEYSALVKTVVPAMRKADPDCTIAAGSLSNYWEPSYQWTEYCFQNGVLETGIDTWSVHPYGVSLPEQHAGGHKRIQKLLQKYNAPADFPLTNTERGYAIAKTETGEGWSGGEAGKTRQYQAWDFVRQVLVDQLCGVRFSSWYEWAGNEGFGLWEADGTPRPAVAAMKELVKELSGYRVVGRLPSDLPEDYAAILENARGEKKLALWTTPAPGLGVDDTWNHKAEVRWAAADRTPAQVALSGAPCYLAVPAGAEPARLVPAEEKPKAPEVSAVAPDGAIDLHLFEEGAAWSFVPNTGKGSFTLGKDDAGTPVGVLAYDFAGAKSKSTPYVIASCATTVESCSALCFFVRTPIPQGLTFRVTDASGQTLQFKARAKGTGTWEPVRFPLDRKLEHWGGKNDGYARFPLKAFVLSVPKPSQDSGKVEYACAYRPDSRSVEAPAPAVASAPAGGPAPALAPASAPAAKPLEGELALNLFDGSAAWEFIPNTGKGSFTLSKDDAGTPFGVLAYDFTGATAQSTPYVLASVPVAVPAGSVFTLQARSPIVQKLTFRLVDSTGQTLQFKTKTKGAGAWTQIRLPLDKKAEHWDGANDGFVHFPLKSFCLSVPRPSADVLSGTVEFADAVVK